MSMYFQNPVLGTSCDEGVQLAEEPNMVLTASTGEMVRYAVPTDDDVAEVDAPQAEPSTSNGKITEEPDLLTHNLLTTPYYTDADDEDNTSETSGESGPVGWCCCTPPLGCKPSLLPGWSLQGHALWEQLPQAVFLLPPTPPSCWLHREAHMWQCCMWLLHCTTLPLSMASCNPYVLWPVCTKTPTHPYMPLTFLH